MISSDSRLLECAVGALFGIVCSPDADVDAGNISNTIIKKKAGWFWEKLWRLFWKKYSESFKHGQFASHFPIFGTFVRISYIYFMTVLPIYGLLFLILPLTNYHLNFTKELWYWVTMFLKPMIFYGLASSDLIHYFLDILTKESAR